MAKKSHSNLFRQVVDGKAEVYQAFQNDFDRDTWHQLAWHVVFWICAIVGTRVTGHTEWIWIFGALYAVERSLSKFVDNSNRNWAMHVIDWMEHRDAAERRAETSHSDTDRDN